MPAHRPANVATVRARIRHAHAPKSTVDTPALASDRSEKPRSAVAWATSALHSERDRADVVPHPPGPGMFVAARCSPYSADSSNPRKRARTTRGHRISRAPVPQAFPKCESSPTARLRATAREQYPTRYLPAYCNRRSSDRTSRSRVEDQVPGAMHRPITRTWIPARRGQRMPAVSQLSIRRHYPRSA